MIDINLATPALLFPAISLLLLAYTNRFLALSALIRSLHALYREDPSAPIMWQLANLRRRLDLIRDMQMWGVVSIFFCVVAMLLVFAGAVLPARISFGAGLLSMLVSLTLSFIEIRMSVGALELQLSDVEELLK